jgi:hypothetical protein
MRKSGFLCTQYIRVSNLLADILDTHKASMCQVCSIRFHAVYRVTTSIVTRFASIQYQAAHSPLQNCRPVPGGSTRHMLANHLPVDAVTTSLRSVCHKKPAIESSTNASSSFWCILSRASWSMSPNSKRMAFNLSCSSLTCTPQRVEYTCLCRTRVPCLQDCQQDLHIGPTYQPSCNVIHDVDALQHPRCTLR